MRQEEASSLPLGVLLGVNVLGSVLAMFMVSVAATFGRSLCKWPATLSCRAADSEPWALLMLSLVASLAGIWLDAVRGVRTRAGETRQIAYAVWGAVLLVGLLVTAQGGTLGLGHLVFGGLLSLCGLALSCWAVRDAVETRRAERVAVSVGLGAGLVLISYLTTVPAGFEAKWLESRQASRSGPVIHETPRVGDLPPLLEEVPSPGLTPTPAVSQ